MVTPHQSCPSLSLSARPSRHGEHLANVHAFMSRREAQSILRSINQPSNAAKELFMHPPVSIFLKNSFDLDCTLHVCYTITASVLRTDDNPKKNTVSCTVAQGLTSASRSERSSLAGLVRGLNQWEA